MPITSKFGHWTAPIREASGTYAVVPQDFGSIVKATAALTATLPPPGPQIAGCWVQFYQAVDANLTIATTANLMVARNDATATSIAFTTGTQKTGSSALLLCDGTMWLAFIDLNQDDQAVTIA